MNLKLVNEKFFKETVRLKIVEVTYQDLQSKKEFTHTIVRSKPSVGVLLFNDDKMAFIKEFRSTTGKYYIEIPAGLIEDNESIIKAAVRETREEAGVDIINCQLLLKGKTYLNISVSDEEFNVCTAEVGLRRRQSLDENEIIDKELIYLKKEEVYDRLNKYLYEGEPFYQDLELSGHTIYALLAYFNLQKEK